MKITSSASFNAGDIREQLGLFHPDLPVGKKLPNGLTIRVLREGLVSNLFLYDEMRKIPVGVACVMKDKLLITPTVSGVRIFASGLLKEYRGLGFMYRVLNSLGEKYRVFASPSMTRSGQKMWMKRIAMDQHHAYLIYRPGGFEVHQEVMGKEVKIEVPFIPIKKGSLHARTSLMFDGSLHTRLIMIDLKDQIMKRYNINPND